jgi:BirA family transcriptional regulator, biotin operon repressor / biotin---[acetyl-CoA-carboxylase] ligase
MHLPDPKLPPMFTGHAVKAPETPLAAAITGARAGSLGAGDIVWSRSTRRATVALILESEVSLAHCGQMMPLAAVALAETLGALAPPRMAVEFGWPDAILLNGGTAGTITLVAPKDAQSAPDTPPNWLVVSIDFALTLNDKGTEPGQRATETCLSEEGAPELTRTDIVEALATRLLAWLHTWQHDGFRPIHDQFYFRVERDRDVTLPRGDGTTITGRLLGFDETAAALVKTSDGKVEALSLLPHNIRA